MTSLERQLKMYKSVISGKHLNDLIYQHNQISHVNITLVKFINRNKIHHDFEYQLGLNVDYNKFNPEECQQGGLYFTTNNKIWLFARYGYYLCNVAIPDDSQIFIEYNKLKADKLIIQDFNQVFYINKLEKYLLEEYITEALLSNPFCIKYIKKISEGHKFMIINKYPEYLPFIPHPSKELIQFAKCKDKYCVF